MAGSAYGTLGQYVGVAERMAGKLVHVEVVLAHFLFDLFSAAAAGAFIFFRSIGMFSIFPVHLLWPFTWFGVAEPPGSMPRSAVVSTEKQMRPTECFR